MAATKSLPQNPSAEHLRKEAKSVARRSAIRLSTAQHRLAREYGYRNWTELIVAVETMAQAQEPGSTGPGSSQSPLPPPRCDAGDLIPVLPLRGLVAFPHDAFPIYVGRQWSIAAVTTARERGSAILLVTQKDARVAYAPAAELYEVGTLGSILKVAELPDGTLKIIVEGQKRARIKRVTFENDFAEAEIEEISMPVADKSSTWGAQTVRSLLWQVLAAWGKREGDYRRIKERVGAGWIPKLENLSEVADLIASHLEIEIAQKQELLEMADLYDRSRKILTYLKH